MKVFERERQDWIIISILILVGFLFVIIAAQLALRFSPTWKLAANMESNLDPNGNFLTHRPDGFIAPVDSAILTQPVWANLFLTPGAPIPGAPAATRTPFLAPTTGVPTQPGTLPVVTNTIGVTITRTSAPIYIPASSTPKPHNTKNPTAITPPSADLQITKTDGVATYAASGTLTYTIVVSNLMGPNNVNNATVTDTFPAQISSANWTCVGAAGAVCAGSGSGNINDLVTLLVGSSVTYTVTVNISPAATGNLTNTASVSLPAGYTDPVPANNTSTDTDSPAVADLQITNSDNATDYVPNSARTYMVVVSNPVGPGNVNGAVVTDTFPVQISSADWNCAGAGGAVCAGSGSGDINDSVNLPVGSSVTYTVNVTIGAGASGALVTTASVSMPPGYTDPILPNDAIDTDNILIAASFPSDQIGIVKDNSITTIGSGSTVTLAFSTPLNVGGHGGDDLVYYEMQVGSGILMDWVIVQISDGYNWYTVLDWGDGDADTNTNIDINLIGGAEDDNRLIDASALYGGTGVAIDVDGRGIPNGTYPYIRIIAPAGDATNDGCDIDAIEVLP